MTQRQNAHAHRERYGVSVTDPDARKVFGKVREVGVLDRSALSRALGRHWSKAKIDSALFTLIEAGLVTEVQVEGKRRLLVLTSQHTDTA
jgi:hypothetical protein